MISGRDLEITGVYGSILGQLSADIYPDSFSMKRRHSVREGL